MLYRIYLTSPWKQHFNNSDCPNSSGHS